MSLSDHNILPFQRPNKRPKTPLNFAFNWKTGLVVLLCYASLTWLIQIPDEGDILALVLAGVLYWAVVQRQRYQYPRELRYHILHCLLFYLFFSFLFILLIKFLVFFISTLALTGLDATVSSALETLMLSSQSGAYLLEVIYGVVMSVLSFMGQTPRIPFISRVAEYWL